MLFTSRLAQVFEHFANENAFCIQSTNYTYKELSTCIAAIQNELIIQHSNAERIGIVLSDTIETYASIIAILLLGKTYVPLHPTHPVSRTQQIIDQAQLQLILTTSSKSEFTNIPTVTSSELNRTDNNIKYASEYIGDKFAYILFTSGSTGTPKGTPITYNNINSFTNAFFALGYRISEQDRFIQMFDLTFDLSVMSYLIPLCIGACVCTIPEKGMKFTNVYSILDEQEITFALMVPSILSFLRPYFSEINLPHLRYSLFCGEALHTDLVQEWIQCAPNAKIENVYGPTEATIFCLTYEIKKNEKIIESNGVICIGKPMNGMEAIIVDEQNQPIEPNNKGELCLCGGQLTPGYLDNEKNKSAFFHLHGKKYYRTGDVAIKQDDENYIYCGRADHQVKIQGFRVELGEIEHHARTINECNAVALVTNSNNGFEQIELILEQGTSNKEAIINILKSKLPSYMVPADVHFISPFPLNTNGKIDRKILKTLINVADGN